MDRPALYLATLRARFWGAMIDGVALLIAGVVILWILCGLGVLQSTLEPDELTLGEEVLLFVTGQVAFLGLNGRLLLTRGQTIGKVVARTRIVSRSGSVPSFWQVYCLRYLALCLVVQVPVLGFFVALADTVAIFREQRRCLHDDLADTWVVIA